MRTQPKGPPDATHGGLAQARLRGQRATAPMRCSLGSLFQGEAYGPFDTVIANLPWCSRPHLVTQTNHPLGDKTIAPQAHGETCGAQLGGHEMRPGAPRQIGDDRVERTVRLTLEEAPKGATHWSSRALAAKTGLSQSTVSRIWRAFGLRPHRSETFQLSNDPLLVDKVR